MHSSTSTSPSITTPSQAAGRREEAPVIVQAQGISKTYYTGAVAVQALREVSLTIHAGEMVAVMGPSGCGKTTLLNCLSGLDRFDRGELSIEGASLRRMSDRARTDYRARRMGFVFQTFNLLPVLTAAENVELPLLVSGVRPKEARRRSLAMLEQVGLLDWAHHRPGELSGGQRQRVTLARALVNDPAIVWADEPTGNLDVVTSGEVLSLMQRLNQEQGQTFVIVTHDPQVSAVCHRVIHMRDGEIIGEQTAEEQDAGAKRAGPEAGEAGA